MFTPNHGLVLVSRKVEEVKTAGGILLPDSAKKKPLEGEVIAVGPSFGDRPAFTKIGDKVLFKNHSGVEIVVDGEDRLLLREDDILGIVG